MIPSSLPKRCLIMAGSDTERLLDSLFGPRGVSTLESPYCLEHFGDERKEQTGSVTHWQKPMYKSWELGSLWFNSTTKQCCYGASVRTVRGWVPVSSSVRWRCGPARASRTALPVPHGLSVQGTSPASPRVPGNGSEVAQETCEWREGAPVGAGILL